MLHLYQSKTTAAPVSGVLVRLMSLLDPALLLLGCGEVQSLGPQSLQVYPCFLLLFAAQTSALSAQAH